MFTAMIKFFNAPKALGAVLALMIALAMLLPQYAHAQANQAVEPNHLSNEAKTARTRLDALKLELDQTEAGLARADIKDADLQAIRQRIDAAIERIRALINEIQPRIDAIKARLEQLGPKPDNGLESEEAARERADRVAALTESDEIQRLGRALLVQAEQIAAEILERRRSLFARALFERSSSLISIDLWTSVLRSFPRDVNAARVVLGDWLSTLAGAFSAKTLFPVIILILAVGGLHYKRFSLIPRVLQRDASVVTPSLRGKALAALTVLIVGSVPGLIGAFLLYNVMEAAGFFPQRLGPFIASLLYGLAFIAFIRALAESLLAPEHGQWRLLSMSDETARFIMLFAVLLAASIALGKAVEALSRVIAVALPVTVAIRGLFAVLGALLLIQILRRISPDPTPREEDCLGPYVPHNNALTGPVRLVGWGAVLTILISVLTGYIAFATFLTDQVMWIFIIGGLFLLMSLISDAMIGGSLMAGTRVATALQSNMGFSRSSVEQMGVVMNGLAKLTLILVAALLVLAPWGIESGDLLSSIRAAIFGFKVGDVTISLSAIAIAALLFTLGFAATRAVQRWLDTQFLPKTELDIGLRNSIRTAFGYAGIVIAAAIAFSYLGLGLDRLTIVAGALSVGIGFGLQSIVNNFVSGLILLWERPIRVGDLIVVGEGEGHVRRINVRATEIETFDRATIIVPNSNLISGVVRNRVRTSTIGRVIVTLPVPRDSDPDQIRALMLACAEEHERVLEEPQPRVLFRKIHDATLEFDLIAFVADVETTARVSSDLYFAIFRRLRIEGVQAVRPAAPSDSPPHNDEKFETALPEPFKP
jgi:potassium-dependent mechanosensitive channel